MATPDRYTRRSMQIRIENLTEAQAIAIESLLATWQTLGGLGSSRWTAFYADGDGHFRPRCYVNGEPAKHTDLVTRDVLWPSVNDRPRAEYRIDFDWIAWAQRTRDEQERSRNGGH